MVSRCANPSCDARFKYLREGRLFQFPAPKLSASFLKNASGFGLWWLCSECSKTMTLVEDPVSGAKLVPLPNPIRKASSEELDPTGSD
jgi:hypothetical protein